VPDFDVVVVGGGVAGLRAAIAARQAGASVALISKLHPLRTNSAVAGGGVNAPLGIDDSVADYLDDIVQVGDGLADSQIAQTLAAEARDEIIWLDRMGVPFNRDTKGKLALRPFGANTRKRTCYVDDRTGHVILQVVYEQFQRARIPAFFDCFVTSLTAGDGASPAVTALALRNGTLELFSSRALVLATGGFTQLYCPSTASLGTTGDGHTLAYFAGARLMDMEMVQFHPTVFPGGPGLLITEAALGEGAEIVDQNGKELIPQKVLPREKLAPAILQATQKSGALALDLRRLGKDRLIASFPQTCELVQAVAAIDPSKEPVPIRPAAHRSIGGIETDINGRTSVSGLFATGGCACNGLNGAGRLAGNALTEALVFGRRVGEAAALHALRDHQRNPSRSQLADEERRLTSLVGPGKTSGDQDTTLKLHAELAKLMDRNVGLARDVSSLESALDHISQLKERYSRIRLRNASLIYNFELTSYLELGSLLNIAELVTRSAQVRTESRGAHWRTDFPQRNDNQWNRHTIVSQVDGAPYIGTRSVQL
jgi:succinate dehydrogenase / fumarate reductase flavoprotein subunit